MRTSEDLKETSGRGDREDWPESIKVEGWSASNCRRNGVNLAISAKGTTLDKTE